MPDDKTNPPQPKPPVTMDGLVAQYVRLRDAIKDADDKHKQKMAPAKAHMDALNNALLARLNEIGGDSVATSAGTAYRTTRRNASIADAEAFRKFVIENEVFDIVDWRANAPAVDDFIKSEGTPPPGVSFSTAYTVGVRRA